MRSPHVLKGRGPSPLFSVAAIFALGALGARVLAAARPPSAFVTDFAQPLVVVTAWGRYGGGCFALLAATIALATVALLVARRAGATKTPPASGTVALAAAAALAAACAWPFVFSSDVYAYAAYGWLGAHGLDPYRPVPSGVHGGFVNAARFQWSGSFPACVYGPAFVAIVRGLVELTAGAPVAATLAALRLLACGAFIGCIFALAASWGDLPERRRFSILAAVALNPVALWSVAEGHNDALLLLAALLGFALLRRGAPVAGAFIIGLSPVLKATGAFFAAGIAVDAFFRAPREARRIVAPLALGIAAAAAFALPVLLPPLRSIGGHGRYLPSVSAQALFGLVPVLGAAGAAAFYGFTRIRKGERDGYAWFGIAAWLALPNPYPWYALWLLPAALAAGGGAAAAALYGVTISSILRYLPDAVGNIGPGDLHLVAALTASPLLLVPAVFALRTPSRKTTSQT